MNLLEIKAVVLQLTLAERSELVELLLQSMEQPPVIALEFPPTTSLGIAESDFDVASTVRHGEPAVPLSTSEHSALRPMGLRARIGLNADSIRESLAPLSPDELKQWK